MNEIVDPCREPHWHRLCIAEMLRMIEHQVIFSGGELKSCFEWGPLCDLRIISKALGFGEWSSLGEVVFQGSFALFGR